MTYKIYDDGGENIRKLFERTIFHPTRSPLDLCDTVICSKELFEKLINELNRDNISFKDMIYPGTICKIKVV